MAKKKQKKKKKMPEQAPRPKDFLDMIAPAAIKFSGRILAIWRSI